MVTQSKAVPTARGGRLFGFVRERPLIAILVGLNLTVAAGWMIVGFSARRNESVSSAKADDVSLTILQKADGFTASEAKRMKVLRRTAERGPGLTSDDVAWLLAQLRDKRKVWSPESRQLTIIGAFDDAQAIPITMRPAVVDAMRRYVADQTLTGTLKLTRVIVDRALCVAIRNADSETLSQLDAERQKATGPLRRAYDAAYKAANHSRRPSSPASAPTPNRRR